MSPTRSLAASGIIVLLAACTSGGSPEPSGDASEPATSAPASAAVPSASATGECAPENLATVADGRLTIGTDNPAFPPYWEPPAEGEEGTDPWELGDPYTKGGFEGAVAWAVAEELGFGDEDVDFIAVPFDLSYAPGE